MGFSSNPGAVCAYGSSNCGAAAGVSRVTMTAQANPVGAGTWPDVQVAFVIETTLYDGVWDSGAGDSGGNGAFNVCTVNTTGVCGISNGVCYFVAHAQAIANAIQAANPHSHVSFALVDYFATLDTWDDSDGAEYHVDVPQFVSTAAFGPAVLSAIPVEFNHGYPTLDQFSVCTYSDSDMSDNFLHSSSITAMYGAIVGSGLNWSAGTHHVVVWMGSTAPRDPSYPENYCVTHADSAPANQNCMSSTCEPSYDFGPGISSPNCEGWVRSQNGNASDSIARLAQTSASCTSSVGGRCTIDMIDQYNAVTNPWSPTWTNPHAGGGPGGPTVDQNVAHVLLSACDLARATGGTWDGPDFFACPDGETGTLQYSPLTTQTPANMTNPTLLLAFRNIGFGPVPSDLRVSGTSQPMFQFVPYGNVRPAPVALGGPQFQSVCSVGAGVAWVGGVRCPSLPVSLGGEAAAGFGWNWSADPAENAMPNGASWSVSFNVVVDGPPYVRIPVDACSSFACSLAGSAPIGGRFSAAQFDLGPGTGPQAQSFPPAIVAVEAVPLAAPLTILPPLAPHGTGGLGLPSVLPTAASAAVTAAVNSPGAFALQALGVGFLAAGVTRMATRQRQRPVAIGVRAGATGRSRFDE